jgi:hypothetical protein
MTCTHLHINQEKMSCRVSAEAYWDNSLKKVKISNFKLKWSHRRKLIILTSQIWKFQLFKTSKFRLEN